MRIGKGDVKWLNAQLWKDAKWVTLITTTFFSTVDDEALRWDKSQRKRVPISISRAIKRYNKFMGAVDQFNKELVKTHMQMGRCKREHACNASHVWVHAMRPTECSPPSVVAQSVSIDHCSWAGCSRRLV